MNKKLSFSLLLLLSGSTAFAQSLTSAPDNWFNLDPKVDHVQGVSTEKTYKELLKGKKYQTTIVAVIDGGVDTTHEDLKAVLWKNKKEIAGNGIDDDKNGYIDDVYGWNFIGGKDGRNINHESMELTRLYAPLDAKYKDAPPTAELAKQTDYQEYLKLKKAYDKELNETKERYETYTGFLKQLNKINDVLKAQLKVNKLDIATLEKVNTGDEKINKLAANIKEMLQANGCTDMDDQIEKLTEGIDDLKGKLDYGLNTASNERAIVGDDPSNMNDNNYGNSDVTGPDAGHGSHVAGIIAAVRNNSIGMNGVADHVQIMAVRAVPNGDERDKDVANAIRYAVDNGARVINMSFGKSYSYDKKAVDDAVKYAASKDVLLIHAAGNDANNNDTTANFPNRNFADGKSAANWIEVGALSWKNGSQSVANFSNYGKNSVDVFAPGVDIYSTVPFSKYKSNSGTSMASPVVAGIAAVIRSYFPQLTALQVKEIILKSAEKLPNLEVVEPGSEDKKLIKFTDLSTTGGVVNLYNAIKLADAQTKQRKK
ncbi:S8 family peptidase [Solitalea sp. MAHUQ-68]|uniref:S8 family peptidase n=1 Tax=Solitalea agri TaxID=2953739 RepID=A0A9X2F2E0_9SPHI|nr:S8 family peptidase [Solitalea agri]MCO4293429.1 S8 family peptidase [Solitalea agri]